MNKSEKQKKNSINIFLNDYFNLLVLFGMIIIFAFAYFLLLGPKFNATTTAIKDSIESQKRLYAEQEKKLKDLKTIKEVYDNISPADLKKFNGVLPEEYIKERLFGELEEIVVKNGYIIKSITIQEDDEKDSGKVNDMPSVGSANNDKSLGKISLLVSIGGIDYSGFKNMLKTFESNSRLFDIQSVSFSQGGNSAELELVTYYFKPLK